MQNFEFRIRGLQPEPIVLHVMTRDVEAARAMAERLCNGACQGCGGIEVRQGRRYLFTVGPAPASAREERCTLGDLAAELMGGAC